MSLAISHTIILSQLCHEGRLRLRRICRFGTGFAFSLLNSFLSLSIHDSFPCGSGGSFNVYKYGETVTAQNRLSEP